jgi:AcrR family transcriptional regulator
MDEKAATRDRILDAAMARIHHYGLGKTTMAEIASDLGMSAGNIYRFYPAKIDIAEAIARRHTQEQHTRLAAIARRTDMTPEQRIREISATKMRENFKLADEDAKILDLAETLARERPRFANESLAAERVYLAALIEEGVEAGHFAPCDPNFEAEMFQCMLVKFSFPQLISRLTLPKLERELAGVLDLAFRGINAR